MFKYIYIKNKRYYLYDTYKTWNNALKVAKHFKKKRNARYFILKYEIDRSLDNIRYALYMTKVVKIWI